MGSARFFCLFLLIGSSLPVSHWGFAAQDEAPAEHVRLATEIACMRWSEGIGQFDPIEVAAVISSVEILTRGRSFSVPAPIAVHYREFLSQLIESIHQAGGPTALQALFLARAEEIVGRSLNGGGFLGLDAGLELALIAKAVLNPQVLEEQDQIGRRLPRVADVEDPVLEWRSRFMNTLGQALGQAATHIVYIPSIGEPGEMKRAALAGLPVAYVNVSRPEGGAGTVRFKGNPDVFGDDPFEFDIRSAANSLYWLVPPLASEFKPAAGFIVERIRNVRSFAFTAEELLINHELLTRALRNASTNQKGVALPVDDQEWIGRMFVALTQVRLSQGGLLGPEVLLRRVSQLPFWFKEEIPVEKLNLLQSRIEQALRDESP
jgi:hypothetical protein